MWMKPHEVSFVSLQAAVFCAECELISANNSPYCMACGSQALLSLSRVLGGSLLDQQTAHLIAARSLTAWFGNCCARFLPLLFSSPGRSLRSQLRLSPPVATTFVWWAPLRLRPKWTKTMLGSNSIQASWIWSPASV